MFCSKCGAKNDEGAKFCRSCGSPMGQAAAPAAPANGYTPNTGYTPNAGYNPNTGYTPRPGYTPNRSGNFGMSNSNIIAMIPIVAVGIAVICLFLPWYVFSAFGNSDSVSIFKAAFDFGSWDAGFSYVLLSLLSFACVAVVGFCLFAAVKKVAYGKFAAIGGAVLALITVFVWDACADAVWSGLSKYAKMGFGFYLYIICMAAYAVVSFLNEKK